MAWIFELAIECGPSRELAIAQKDYFDSLEFSLDGGSSSFCIVQPRSIAADEEQNWWLSVVPMLRGNRPIQHSDNCHQTLGLVWMCGHASKANGVVLEVGADGLFNHVDRDFDDEDFLKDLNQHIATAFWVVAERALKSIPHA